MTAPRPERPGCAPTGGSISDRRVGHFQSGRIMPRVGAQRRVERGRVHVCLQLSIHARVPQESLGTDLPQLVCRLRVPRVPASLTCAQVPASVR
jgi:hypothetical protein